MMDDPNTLPTLLQALAERAANSIALRHKVLDIWTARSWRELRDEVAAVASGLAAIGFRAGDRIWIATDVRPEPLLAALAAHWLGGTALVADASGAAFEGVRTRGRVEREAAGRLGRVAARFALVQDAVLARAWREREPAIRFVHLDGRGAAGDELDQITYRSLMQHGAAAHVVSTAPAVLVAGASVRRYASSRLLAAAAAATIAVSADSEAEAAGLPLDAQLTTVLPLWLHTGMCLSFVEDAGTTADADRRELGPSVILSTPDDIERLRQRVVESLPPSGLRALESGPLRARARKSVRDALGWAHARTLLVHGALAAPAATFLGALELPVHTLHAPSGDAELDAGASARLPPMAASPLPPAATSLPTREPFLRLAHISLAFNEVKAVNDISFQVARHEICALIGPNGAGKSSLLNVINGIYRPNSGEIHFDGQVRSEMTPRAAAQAGIARTFQNLAIFKGMTVLENVIVGRNLSVKSSWLEQALWLGRARVSEDASRQRAEEILAFLRLQRYRHVPAAQLPYGLQKRVELGRALVADPRLLLLDEPMAGMNADEKSDMSEIILDVNRELGTTVVLIEHDMRVVMDISDHVVVLDYGRLVGDGTPAEVRQNPDVLRAYLGRKRVA